MFKPMNQQDYDELERQQRERNAKIDLAFQACELLVKSFLVTPESSNPQYPAYKRAMQALRKEPL